MSETEPILIDESIPENHKSGFVAVVGRPNVGKSTLLNAMLRQKIAIVSPRPQTTRLKQLGIVTEADHQIVFVDTPGIMQKAMHKLDELMLDAAVDTLNDGDIILWMIDASFLPNEEDARLAEMMKAAKGQIVLVMNKNDLVPPNEVIERTEAYRSLLPKETPWFFISAERKYGIEELYQTLVDHLPEGPRYYPEDQITETFTRDIVAELIREQLLLHLREEIPHAISVAVTRFDEESDPLNIQATIYVERESHKPIVIGSKGSMLKRIGSEARREIEPLVDRQVFLELWVKVAEKWRKQEAQLKRFGYIKD
ncbi:MAG: GTPase Era [Chloroflexota bacterium]